MCGGVTVRCTALHVWVAAGVLQCSVSLWEVASSVPASAQKGSGPPSGVWIELLTHLSWMTRSCDRMRFPGWAWGPLSRPSPCPACSLEVALGPVWPSDGHSPGCRVASWETVGQKQADPWPSDGVWGIKCFFPKLLSFEGICLAAAGNNKKSPHPSGCPPTWDMRAGLGPLARWWLSAEPQGSPDTGCFPPLCKPPSLLPLGPAPHHQDWRFVSGKHQAHVLFISSYFETETDHIGNIVQKVILIAKPIYP